MYIQKMSEIKNRRIKFDITNRTFYNPGLCRLEMAFLLRPTGEKLEQVLRNLVLTQRFQIAISFGCLVAQGAAMVFSHDGQIAFSLLFFWLAIQTSHKIGRRDFWELGRLIDRTASVTSGLLTAIAFFTKVIEVNELQDISWAPYLYLLGLFWPVGLMFAACGLGEILDDLHGDQSRRS